MSPLRFSLRLPIGSLPFILLTVDGVATPTPDGVSFSGENYAWVSWRRTSGQVFLLKVNGQRLALASPQELQWLAQRWVWARTLCFEGDARGALIRMVHVGAAASQPALL